MTYEQLLGRQPLSTQAGDRNAAREFVAAISAFIEGSDAALLDVSQKNYLYKLRQKWNLRAKGEDEAWNQYGSTPGRRKKPANDSSVDKTAYGDGEEMDPLLASIISKYGRKR